jgi:hypothetical protein
MALEDMARGYLQAAGYTVAQRGKDLIIGTRRSQIGQETEAALVWVPVVTSRDPFARQEAGYLDRFKQLGDEYPYAQKFMLVPSYEGISSAFRSGAKQWHNVNIRIPVQFFDTPYKGEDSPEAREATVALAALRGSAENIRRVPQPFTIGDGRQVGEDLLPRLVEQISRPDEGKGIHIVVGPAGIGKTVLFESLFSKLLADFLQDKKDQRLIPRPRPLPLMPEYLRYSVAPTVKALVDAFLATEFSASTSRSIFEWMITDGFGVWLLDGLDEVISRDRDFFYYLLELLTTPGRSSPRVVICVRDSLLATNDDINDFREEYGNVVEIYELSKWQLASKRRFATLTLGNKGEQFISTIGNRTDLDELSSTPYYCALLAEQFKSGKLKEDYTESALLSDAVSSIIQREYGKGLLDKDLVPEAAVTEFLEALAAENMEEGYQGIRRDAVEEWARIVLPSDLSEEELTKLLTDLVQLAVFSQGSVIGNVQFAQEILERYLLGAFLAHRLDHDMSSFVRTLSLREIPAEWVTLKVVADFAREHGKLAELIEQTYQPLSDLAFKNLVQIVALAATDEDALKDLSMERRDLSGLIFRDLNLSSVSFRDSDLTDVEFGFCNLRGASFEGAVLKNTAFLVKDRSQLAGAEFGQMERFHSLRTETGKILVDHNALEKWITRSTGTSAKVIEPCAPARQLRHMLGKFVYPDGTARRHMLDRQGVLSGKRFYDTGDTLEAALKYGYLLEEERFGRIKRPDGDYYSEVINYVKDLRLSPGIKSLLDDICKAEGCTHVPIS